MAKEKVVLPKEVAEAIEWMRRLGIRDYLIASEMFTNTPEGEMCIVARDRLRKYAICEEDRTDIIMAALVVGYEVERSPEDRLRETYLSMTELVKKTSDKYSHRADGFTHGVEITLNALGITIEGINDKEAK